MNYCRTLTVFLMIIPKMQGDDFREGGGFT